MSSNTCYQHLENESEDKLTNMTMPTFFLFLKHVWQKDVNQLDWEKSWI